MMPKTSIIKGSSNMFVHIICSHIVYRKTTIILALIVPPTYVEEMGV